MNLKAPSSQPQESSELQRARALKLNTLAWRNIFFWFEILWASKVKELHLTWKMVQCCEVFKIKPAPSNTWQHDNMSFSFPCLPFIQHNTHSIKQIFPAQNDLTNYLQGVKQVLEITQPSSLMTRQLFLNTFLGHVLSNRMLCLPEAKWRPFLKYCVIWFPLCASFILSFPQNCFLSVQQFQDLNETLRDWNVPSSLGGGNSCASERTSAFLLRSITKGYSNAIIDLFIHNVKV